MPDPTGAPPTNRYAPPIQPTPTTQTQDNQSPPPPQPGAAPVPPASSKPNIPPPPKAGETFHPPEQTPAPQPASAPYPPQMGMPPPTAPFAQRGTMPATSYGAASHPPGYHQNANASEFSSSQRAANLALTGSGNGTGGTAGDEGEEGVWGAARGYLQAAGEKLAAAETEVWRRINKE